ncbi:MAG TPA: dephospho-CoA kinase [Oscillospiraceae bacterium]|nr:dephospho-CoA kinase [Oscillospiraceae bacterium]
MLVIGLTGGIATGKSTVADLFAKLGAYRIDTDHLARLIVVPGKPAWQAIIQYFGEEILLPDGQINRSKLGKLVFSDAKKRQVLENITHPAIRELMQIKLSEARANGICLALVEVPQLFETDFHQDVDQTIVVTAGEEQQLVRLAVRDGLVGEDARQRLAAQMPLSAKAARADYVIVNNGDLAETERQVKVLWQLLQRECVND